MTREIIDFRLERGRHERLLGREDVLAELDRLLQEGGASRGWVLVKGGPGKGKSALLAHYLARLEEGGRRVPHHFLRRGVEDWAQPEAVSRNLATQLEALYPEQRDAEPRPESRLREVLQRISDQVLVPRRGRLVLVIDGLDEADVDESARNPLPRILPHSLPPGVHVLCASRPEYPYLDWLEAREGLRCIDLDDAQWAGSNNGVIQRYWDHVTLQFEPPLNTDFIREAVKQSDGNMLYAVKLAEWLVEQPVERRRVELLPRGLKAFLSEIWQRVLTQPQVALPALRLVTVAREVLPRSVLGKVVGWDDTEVSGEQFLRVARPFLLEETHGQPGLHKEASWRLFHESFRAFILEKLGAGGARREHRRLAEQLCAWPVEGEEDGFRRRYALRHGVAHWLEAGDPEQASALCTDLGYLEAKCREVGVFKVEEDLPRAAKVLSESQQDTLRALHWALHTSEHRLMQEPETLPLRVYNRLRCLGWTEPQISEALLFPDGLPALRLRHPVRLPNDDVRMLVWQAMWREQGGDELLSEGQRDRLLRSLLSSRSNNLQVPGSHEREVNACAVAADGRRAVSASSDGTLKVWNLETGLELATLQGHTKTLWGCAITADGKRVVSASADGSLKVWDVDAGRELVTLRGHEDSVWGCAMTQDGKRVVSSSFDQTLRVWDADTGRVLTVLRGHTEGVPACALTADGQRVVSASKDKTLKVWDVESGRELVTLKGHAADVMACAVTPDGKRVVSASFDETLKVWELETGRELLTLRGHEGRVRDCAVTTDGRYALSASRRDGSLRVWDLRSGQGLYSTYKGQYLYCVATARDLICAGDGHGNVWMMELEPKKQPVVPQFVDDRADLGILIALKEEFREFHKLRLGRSDSDPRRDEETGQYDYFMECPETGYRCVVTFMGGMNPSLAGLHTERLIRRWQPRTIVMLGIAAGLHSDVKAGDVVVASQVDNYMDSAKAESGGPEGAFALAPGGAVFSGDHDFITRIRNLEFVEPEAFARWRRACETSLTELLGEEKRLELVRKGLIRKTPEFSDGHLASGPVVGATQGFAAWLRRRDRTLKALEMESAGLMMAAVNRIEPKRTLVIRGISDYGDERKQDLDAVGEGAVRRYAMHNATHLLWALLETGGLPKHAR